MARPTKQGIDYFPLDCQFDDKTEMYLIEKGSVGGLGVLVCLWQMIYSNHGYYVIDSDDLHLLIKRKIDSDINVIIDCINACLRRGLFDASMYEKHNILTSKAIQKRYFEAAKKKKSVSVCVDYVINGVNSCDNWVYVDGNATNVKEEVKEEVEVKVDVKGEGEEKKKPKPKKTFKPPSLEEVIAYSEERNSTVDPNHFFEYFDTGNWKDKQGDKVKNWKQKFISWDNRENKNKSNQSRTSHDRPKTAIEKVREANRTAIDSTAHC